VGHDLSTKFRVGPKGTEMRFLLITFERGHLRSSYLVGRWGGQDLSTKYRVGLKGTEMKPCMTSVVSG
jgi:hypothetical protein